SQKLDPRGFIGGFARLTIVCLHGDADQRSGPNRPKRTPNPHRAVAGSDRAAPSNCRAGARRTRRPCFRRIDRLFWILLSGWWPQWRESLLIVQPESVLRWRHSGWVALPRYL